MPGGETERDVSGWTVDTLHEHVRILRIADERFLSERDRRMTEVALEREKALKIKETADMAALQLAREIQTYKDEKMNGLRSQIERERGTYVTQTEIKSLMQTIDAQMAPLLAYVTGEQAKVQGAIDTRAIVALIVAVVVAIVGVVAFFNAR